VLLRGSDALAVLTRHNGSMSPFIDAQGDLKPRFPRLRRWLGDSFLVLLIVMFAFAPYPDTEFRTDSILVQVLTLLPAVLLPFRRRWPIAVLAACIVVFGAVAVAGTLAPALVLAIAVALFSLASRSDRRTTAVAAGATVITIGLLSLLASLGSVLDPRIVQFLFIIAFAAAAGDGHRSRRAFIAAITERAVRAEESKEQEAKKRVTEERLRIARDLHDVVAHQIAVISLNAGVASASLESKPEKARESLGTIRSAARVVLGEIGDLLEMLRADSDDPADSMLPQPGLAGIDALVASFAESGLRANLRIEGDLGRISGATALVSYRVIQEALTNAHKYGAEGRAHVLISVDVDVARIVVTNPSLPAGEKSDSTVTASGTGLGLVGLRERVASVRGSVETGFVGGTYRLVATLPVVQEDSP